MGEIKKFNGPRVAPRAIVWHSISVVGLRQRVPDTQEHQRKSTFYAAVLLKQHRLASEQHIRTHWPRPLAYQWDPFLVFPDCVAKHWGIYNPSEVLVHPSPLAVQTSNRMLSLHFKVGFKDAHSEMKHSRCSILSLVERRQNKGASHGVREARGWFFYSASRPRQSPTPNCCLIGGDTPPPTPKKYIYIVGGKPSGRVAGVLVTLRAAGRPADALIRNHSVLWPWPLLIFLFFLVRRRPRVECSSTWAKEKPPRWALSQWF